MDAHSLLFTPHNLAKLSAHGISQMEVEEMVAADAWVPYAHPYYANQMRVVGPTRRGRIITVVVEETDVHGEWRPVTGWDATEDEREYYREEWSR